MRVATSIIIGLFTFVAIQADSALAGPAGPISPGALPGSVTDVATQRVCALGAATGGYHGIVSRNGVGVQGSLITFQHEFGCVVKSVRSGVNGSYSINLSPGRYVVIATDPVGHPYTTAWCQPGQSSYDASVGFFVVPDSAMQVGNIFLQ